MNPPLPLFPDLPAPATPPPQTSGTLQIAIGVVLRLDLPRATMVPAPGPKGQPGIEPSKETQARIDEAIGRIAALHQKPVILSLSSQVGDLNPVLATLSNPKILGSYLAPELPLREAPTVADPLEPQTPPFDPPIP